MRFAVVMYGGVSLAIYIYGVAQELLNLVKATAPAEPGNSDHGELAFQDESTLPVYRKLARLIGAPEADAGSGPVRVRFVVDLISGSSAGGLNGVCLATALAKTHPARRRSWSRWSSSGSSRATSTACWPTRSRRWTTRGRWIRSLSCRPRRPRSSTGGVSTSSWPTR